MLWTMSKSSRLDEGRLNRVLSRLAGGLLCLLLLACFALTRPRFYSGPGDPKIPSARSDEAIAAAALHQFDLDCNRYPTTGEGLAALRKSPENVKKKWKGPYLERPIGDDPWGNPYTYSSHGREFTIIAPRSSNAEGIIDTE